MWIIRAIHFFWHYDEYGPKQFSSHHMDFKLGPNQFLKNLDHVIELNLVQPKSVS